MHALISVSDKTGVVELARELAALGVKLLSTGGTAKLLADAGLAVTEVAEHTGFPEMLDGRVKTLHPTIHGGLLARRDERRAHGGARRARHRDDRPARRQSLSVRGDRRASAGCTLADAIENIDIGGPAMVRSAAKNWNDVAVLTDASQYAGVVAELKRDGAVCERDALRARGRRVRPHRPVRRRDQRLPVVARRPERRRPRAARVPGAGERPLRQAAGPALRREPAPARRLLSRPRARAGLARHRQAAAGQGALVQQHRRRRRGVGMRQVASTRRRA